MVAVHAPSAGSVPRANAALPYLLALLVLGVYATVFVVRAQRPGGALTFAVLGTSNTPGNRGYDGQYYYRLATAPLGGRPGLDHPAYRYQRIGYPLLAWLLALGQRARVATTLVLVNVAAIGLGTLGVALLLRRNGFSPLYALAYALYAGQAGSFWRDLAEPLAFTLVAMALLLLRPERVWPAALALSAAALVKETALLFAAALALHLLPRGNRRGLLIVLALVALPYAAWQATLWLSFGQTGVAGADHPPRLPLGGLTGVRGARQLLFDLLAVVIPALLCLPLVWLGLRHAWHARTFAEGEPPPSQQGLCSPQRHGDTGVARSSESTPSGCIPCDAQTPVTTDRSRGVPAMRPQSQAPVPTHTVWWRVALDVAGDLSTLMLLANLAFVLWLPARSYADLWASARNAQGLVLAALASPVFGATRLRWPLVVLWAGCGPLLWLQ